MRSFPKLDKYILFKYLKTFLLAMALIIVIVITFDVSEKLDDFLGGHAPFREIVFDYYFNFIPGFVNLYSPLFIFISVIFFTSKMAGNTEVIAILGSGISYKRMLRPYLYGSIMVALLVLAIGNFLIPVNNRTLAKFENKYIYQHQPSYFSNLHFQPSKGVQIYADSYESQSMRAHFFHRDTYDENYRLVDRITCTRITYDTVSGKWECENFVHRTIDGRKERLTRDKHSMRKLDVAPADFDANSVNITTMNSIKLYRHIQQMKMRGSTAVISAKIELYQRLLNPFAIIIMTFIGVGVSSRKSRGGIGVHLAIGITLAFGFIVFMKVSTVFAVFGTLNPFISVLLPQAVFALIAAYVVRTAPK
ncbi:MAG: LptF/LptG family permease [Bacteroidales bacterium]|nr:LptF/LptG family permease [Bacteroidales bacterium]